MKRQPPKTPARLSDSVHHQLNMYALAASAAGVGALALAQPAEAKIVYTKTHKVINEGFEFVSLDLNHDGIPDFKVGMTRPSGSAVGASIVASPARSSGTNTVRFTNVNFWAAAYPAGVRIGPRGRQVMPLKGPNEGVLMEHGCASSSTSACKNSGTFGNWLNVKERYLGLKFSIKGKVHYGWARLNAYSDGLRATLTGYAYETVANKPIITGKTNGPDVITVQPGSLGHLAAGASEIPAWRSGK